MRKFALAVLVGFDRRHDIRDDDLRGLVSTAISPSSPSSFRARRGTVRSTSSFCCSTSSTTATRSARGSGGAANARRSGVARTCTSTATLVAAGTWSSRATKEGATPPSWSYTGPATSAESPAGCPSGRSRAPGEEQEKPRFHGALNGTRLVILGLVAPRGGPLSPDQQSAASSKAQHSAELLGGAGSERHFCLSRIATASRRDRGLLLGGQSDTPTRPAAGGRRAFSL